MIHLLKLFVAIAVSFVAAANAGELAGRYSFPPAPDMVRADVYAVPTIVTPRAVLVLCPGFNGDGSEFFSDKAWKDFATVHQLGVIYLSFASDPKNISKARGYYVPSSGSGQIVLNAVRKIYGADLPILIYGFSSGAFFSHQFADWRPQRVLAWAAEAGSNGQQMRHSKDPPGLVACGALDQSKFAGALDYFHVGRSMAKPWLLVRIPRIAHERSAAFEDFVRLYFAAALGSSRGGWVDVDRKAKIPAEEATQNPSTTGWLPDENLFNKWKEIHE